MSNGKGSFAGDSDGVEVPEEGWVAVRRGGKLLFEYHPELELVRVVRRKRPFVVDLKGYRGMDGAVVTNI